MVYLVHIVAGTLALLSGYIALYSGKGERAHRRAGMVFVYSMLAMCAGGLLLAFARGAAPYLNVPAALLTAYLVITALTTVRPVPSHARWLDAGGLAVALGVGLVTLALGAEAALSPDGLGRDRMPAFPFFMFGVVGMLAASGDLRVMRSGPRRGKPRVARHLWRMCFALFVASMSFFIGQAQVIPEPLRIRPLLALPVLAVLATMFYWLARLRTTRRFNGVLAVVVAEEASGGGLPVGCPDVSGNSAATSAA